MNDTVFALSTPVGGAIAIIRISGPDTRGVLSRLFDGRVEHRRASFGRILDVDGETADTATVTFYEAPHSYTGEDMAEISIHGSAAAVRKVSELLTDTGLVLPAGPGEFTKRAYLNGKMDLAQAEAVMDMISASAERSRRAAAMQLEGRLSGLVHGLYDGVKAALAQIAAYLDDDSAEPEYGDSGIAEAIGDVLERIRVLVSGGLKARVLREGARIAIIGSPNVGKSSLLNALILRERAIVTPVPGTTRDTLEEPASIDGVPVLFIDTAGIRETRDEVEAIGVSRAKHELEAADVILLAIDGSRSVTAEELALIRETLEKYGKNSIAVLTKADLEHVNAPEGGKLGTGLCCGTDVDAVAVSAFTGEGLDGLKRLIAERIVPAENETAVTNARHIAALEAAECSLLDASVRMEEGLPDAAFEDLRDAMDALASITGAEDAGEDLVNEVFSRFCIGK